MAGFGQSPAARRGALLPYSGGASGAFSPSLAWTGAAGSGFLVTPSDRTRTTAKPAVRLLDRPFQYFNEALTIGVMAFANDGGTLIGGIDRVRVHYEGSTRDIVEPTLRSFTRYDGSTYKVPGYWVTLNKPAGTSGDAHVYFEAIPADATMQSRIIGPFRFSPHELFPNGTLHDIDLTVDNTQPIVAGVNYHDFTAAHSYLNVQAARNPRITIKTLPAAGFHEIRRGHFARYAPRGWLTVQATIPIIFDRPGPFIDETSATSATAVRPNLDGILFEGPNITIELARMSIYSEFDTEQHGCGFDRVRIQNSAGITVNWMGTLRSLSCARGRNYYTDCYITDVPNTFAEQTLVRGNVSSGSWWDYATNAFCVVANIVDDHSSAEWLTHTLALSAQYTGAGATATLEMTGANDATSRIITAKVAGATVGTLTVFRVGSSFIPTRAEFPRDIVNWINTLPGWTATLHNDDLRASILGLISTLGSGFGPQKAKTAPLQLYTRADPHNDWWQALIYGGTTPTQNMIVYGNIATNFAGQKFFLSTTNPLHDVVFLNNAIHDLKGVAVEPNGVFLSQFDRGTHSHVVIAHNSLEQGLWLRTSTANPFSADSYCLLANNVFSSIVWEGPRDVDQVIKGNHTFTGSSAPLGASAHTTGGNGSSLFAAPQAGDFTPINDLVSSPKTAVAAFDLTGLRRNQITVAGAIG